MNFSQLMPTASSESIQLMKDTLEWDPARRPNSNQILQYSYFQNTQGLSRVDDAGAGAGAGSVNIHSSEDAKGSSKEKKPLDMDAVSLHLRMCVCVCIYIYMHTGN
jgi:hypothetical protein